jgi:pimeloyl-ACP methyl ester carboxylesterase
MINHLLWILAVAASLIQHSLAEPWTLEQLRAKYQDPQGKILNVRGVDVYFKDEGQGPALLMVHGSQSSLRTWDVVADQLTSRYRVIRYDIPPQGLSGPLSDEALTALQPVDIAEELLNHLGVDKITFIGVSSGGTLGVFLAAKRPDLVERLILSNTPADTVKTDHLPASAEFDEAQRIAAMTGKRDRKFWDAFLNYFSGDPSRLSDQTRQQYTDFNNRVPEPNIIGLVARVADQDKAKAAMAAVRAPTLLIWGGKDVLLVPASADALASYLSGTQVSKVMMPDVGHYPPVEAPVRFADIVRMYIESATP